MYGFDLREALEVLAVRRAAERADATGLATTVEPLEGRLRWLLQQIDEPGTLWEEHRQLHEAIAAHDADAAAAAALSHVRHYRDVAMRMLFGG
ncbi:FCD domain-containing protein [Streptomyces violens]|uniref:FCD domain-containing protein n=1 Tax=Streptomyces violens TaxID=66377 RepID=UPI000A49F285|nr:FCD domain-containing protein [Streptomyces violens]